MTLTHRHTIARLLYKTLGSFLNERKAVIRLRNPINQLGVPQGSVLFPTLYILYTYTSPQSPPTQHHNYTTYGYNTNNNTP